MSEKLSITMTTTPGTLTAEKASEIAGATIDLLNAIGDDVTDGLVRFRMAEFAWIDDGKDEITVTVLVDDVELAEAGEATGA